MVRSGRLIPFVLMGLLAFLALSAAVIGILGSPSSDQLSLETAAERTAEAPSFNYTITYQIESIRPVGRAIQVRLRGAWRAPNQWRVASVGREPASTTTIEGSILHVSDGNGPPLVLQFSSPDLTESMTDPSSPVLSLPPLGLLLTATDVTRTGDKYSFVVPMMNIGVTGWVAYAPLSDTPAPLELTEALETRVDAVIKNGYVTFLDFPDGIRPLRGGSFRDANWQISNVGNAAFRNPPNTG